jgi:hypothetical protein
MGELARPHGGAGVGMDSAGEELVEVSMIDLQQKQDGHLQVRFGLAEKWIVATVVFLLTSGASVFGWYLLAKLEKVDSIDIRATRIEEKVSNGNKSLDAILPIVADHTVKLTDHEARLREAEKDIDDLKQTKGLR